MKITQELIIDRISARLGNVSSVPPRISRDLRGILIDSRDYHQVLGACAALRHACDWIYDNRSHDKKWPDWMCDPLSWFSEFLCLKAIRSNIHEYGLTWIVDRALCALANQDGAEETELLNKLPTEEAISAIIGWVDDDEKYDMFWLDIDFPENFKEPCPRHCLPDHEHVLWQIAISFKDKTDSWLNAEL